MPIISGTTHGISVSPSITVAAVVSFSIAASPVVVVVTLLEGCPVVVWLPLPVVSWPAVPVVAVVDTPVVVVVVVGWLPVVSKPVVDDWPVVPPLVVVVASVDTPVVVGSWLPVVDNWPVVPPIVVVVASVDAPVVVVVVVVGWTPVVVPLVVDNWPVVVVTCPPVVARWSPVVTVKLHGFSAQLVSPSMNTKPKNEHVDAKTPV